MFVFAVYLPAAEALYTIVFLLYAAFVILCWLAWRWTRSPGKAALTMMSITLMVQAPGLYKVSQSRMYEWHAQLNGESYPHAFWEMTAYMENQGGTIFAFASLLGGFVLFLCIEKLCPDIPHPTDQD